MSRGLLKLSLQVVGLQSASFDFPLSQICNLLPAQKASWLNCSQVDRNLENGYRMFLIFAKKNLENATPDSVTWLTTQEARIDAPDAAIVVKRLLRITGLCLCVEFHTPQLGSLASGGRGTPCCAWPRSLSEECGFQARNFLIVT